MVALPATLPPQQAPGPSGQSLCGLCCPAGPEQVQLLGSVRGEGQDVSCCTCATAPRARPPPAPRPGSAWPAAAGCPTRRGRGGSPAPVESGLRTGRAMNEPSPDRPARAGGPGPSGAPEYPPGSGSSPPRPRARGFRAPPGSGARIPRTRSSTGSPGRGPSPARRRPWVHCPTGESPESPMGWAIPVFRVTFGSRAWHMGSAGRRTDGTEPPPWVRSRSTRPTGGCHLVEVAPW